ncbi:DNA-directed RNA polymerase II subunit RPB7 [Prunus yedoensis var. nudiflora]|uniref:DNA-directed RNA polymerase II subunit RPB7 n=1 Tax=Prunus yedoensis var. nudiflora TaxID=2094558 RepID=A0A314Y519_PRUYE|nr:DNA-directed RNA polymerase II subunit RPB7 [Prunus yedoensis var. nudiflora]
MWSTWVCGCNYGNRKHWERADSRWDRVCHIPCEVPIKMGFFAEAGPIQIFVSNHLIPDEMEFQYGDMPNYTTSDGSVKIQKDSEVWLKIIGTRFCIGTIKDDFLGVINDPATA